MGLEEAKEGRGLQSVCAAVSKKKNRKRENRGKVERIWGEKERLRGRERSRDRKDLEKTSGEKNRLWKKMGES